jgi:hypothetical protein
MRKLEGFAVDGAGHYRKKMKVEIELDNDNSAIANDTIF